jgi:hypothetical protein
MLRERRLFSLLSVAAVAGLTAAAPRPASVVYLHRHTEAREGAFPIAIPEG